MKHLPGERNINELIKRSQRDTMPPTSIQPSRKRRRRKIDSRVTSGFIGIILGAAGHAIITRNKS